MYAKIIWPKLGFLTVMPRMFVFLTLNFLFYYVKEKHRRPNGRLFQ